MEAATADRAVERPQGACVTVHFIGAGPGAADLLTLRGARLIAHCPVCVYAGSLVPAEVLGHAAADARLVDTQSLSLDEIVEELRGAHERGEDVARLHSGDLSIYSALGEQARRLDELGIPWDVTPGVPAFAAAAATLRRELTLPGVAQSVILTRHSSRSTALPAGEELASLAAHRTTLVLHLAVQAMDEIAETLARHYGSGCPAVVVARASWPDELVLAETLATVAAAVREAGVRRTAIVFVGPALATAAFAESHLYSSSRERPGSA
jgi:precorrin-4/cobalt-precorrin-4 C11-methyltransferase